MTAAAATIQVGIDDAGLEEVIFGATTDEAVVDIGIDVLLKGAAEDDTKGVTEEVDGATHDEIGGPAGLESRVGTVEANTAVVGGCGKTAAVVVSGGKRSQGDSEKNTDCP